MAENITDNKQQAEDLHQQLSMPKDYNVSDFLTDLDENKKRWMVTGIVLQSVLAPVLRKYVTIIMEQLYQTLKLNNNIDTQLYPNHLKRYHTTFLNYEAINGNKALGRGQHSRFNYQVKDAVDLSKLFLQTHNAYYNAFDDCCELFQLIFIVIECGPAHCQVSADEVRVEVVNTWAHCDFSVWNDSKYESCMMLINDLIQSLGLDNQREIINQVQKWNHPIKQTNKQKWNQNVSECLTDLDKNERRWLVTGIVLHSVLAPVLRKYVTIIMEQLYQTLKLNSNIDTQLYPNHLKNYHTTFLNYEAINGNKALALRQQSRFNYQVKDAVDLSKLFLQTHMAHYNAFDDNCELSQLIAIVIGCGPAQCQASARKVRLEVRNQWAHCNRTVWDVYKFKTCMVLIKELIERLDLEDHGETLAELKKLNQNGEKFINATPFNVPEEIQASEELSAITEKADQTPFPSAVYKMDDKSKALYAQALESGSEIKREIRVIIVGKKGAGKTSLTRRLLSKSIDDVTSTNGIDIHSITCEGLRGTWYEKKPTTADSRLLVGTIQMEKKLQEKLKEIGEKKELNIDKSEAEVTHPPIDNDDNNKKCIIQTDKTPFIIPADNNVAAEIKIQVLCEPIIMAAFGSSLRVSARIECNPKLTGIKVSWQKVVNKAPVTLDINSKKYQGSTNEIHPAVLIIRGVSNADAGEYQIEVGSTTGTVVSQQVIIEVFKDSLDVSPLMVNGYAVDCIVGELHNHYQITKSSDTVEALVDVHDCQLEDYCSKVWNELGILNTLVTWTLSDNKQPEYWLDELSSWMATNYSDTVSEVPCRFILSRLKCILDQSSVVKLMEIYQKAISTHKTKTAKAIAWHLVRSFLQSQPDLKFQDMWPGIECDSNEFVIVVEVKDGQETSSQCDFYGTNVKFHTSNGFSVEARNIVQKMSSIDMSRINVLEMKGVCAEEAEHLFSRHRNLTLISKSPLKSNRCTGKKEEFELVITPCIQLFCRVKGVVPVGEPQFPRFINNIRTDVIEGYSEFGCKTLKIGNEVGWCNSGTLGGFLKYRGKNAFLTCAHVLFEREHLALDADISFINEQEISISCNKENHGLIECGTYADHRFPPYRNTDDGVSIDAAIVRLFDDWCPIPQNCIYLHNSALDCRGIGTKENITVCACGAVSGTKEYNVNIAIPKNPSVIEFEQLHQLLERTWHTVAQAGISANEHARITFIEAGETDKKIPRRVELYNQIAFHQIGFKQGDSGMCIYGKDETGIKGCYGMAIAAHASGGCIVTPMTSILTALNIPQPKKANQ